MTAKFNSWENVDNTNIYNDGSPLQKTQCFKYSIKIIDLVYRSNKSYQPEVLPEMWKRTAKDKVINKFITDSDDDSDDDSDYFDNNLSIYKYWNTFSNFCCYFHIKIYNFFVFSCAFSSASLGLLYLNLFFNNFMFITFLSEFSTWFFLYSCNLYLLSRSKSYSFSFLISLESSFILIISNIILKRL